MADQRLALSASNKGGGKGGTTVTGTELADILNGTTGNDTIDGRGGADSMSGGRGNDIYYVDNSGDAVNELAGEGLDEVRTTVSYALPANVEVVTLLGTEGITGVGNELDNRMTGNSGFNILQGLGGQDYIVGGAGQDFIDGGTGYDHMDGGADSDIYVVDNPMDMIIERFGGGWDSVHSSINYQLGAELEHLTLVGSAYVGHGNFLDNRLTGNELNNHLDGHEGNDRLDGGAGNDTLTGGSGADSFVFASTLGAGNVDQIVDFQPGVDEIQLDDAVFAGLVPGELPSGAFHTGSAATDAGHRIIYDAATGALFFDADGVGGAEAVQFATVQANLSLTAADFSIV